MKTFYIENCFYHTPKQIYNSLKKVRKIGEPIRENTREDILYGFGDDGELTATVGNGHPQKITFDYVQTTMGERSYFICEGCKKRRHKLFLLPEGSIFRCAECHGIKRQVFNTASQHGKLFDKTRKILKLIRKQEEMTSRIWYRDSYTKR